MADSGSVYVVAVRSGASVPAVPGFVLHLPVFHFLQFLAALIWQILIRSQYGHSMDMPSTITAPVHTVPIVSALRNLRERAPGPIVRQSSLH